MTDLKLFFELASTWGVPGTLLVYMIWLKINSPKQVDPGSQVIDMLHSVDKRLTRVEVILEERGKK